MSASINGSYIARAKTARKIAASLRFTGRSPEEIEAMAAFWDEHHPAKTFIYRDEAVSPAADYEVRFTSGVSHSLSGYQIGDYELNISEV